MLWACLENETVKKDCNLNGVMADAFETAWGIVKALPQQQAYEQRGPGTQFRFADLKDGPDMGHGYESRGTIHPAILGMMARREKEKHDKYVDEWKPNERYTEAQNRMLKPTPKTIEGILEEGDLDVDAEYNYRNRQGFGRGYEKDNVLLDGPRSPPRFEYGWSGTDEHSPSEGHFEYTDWEDDWDPHWMSHPTRDEVRETAFSREGDPDHLMEEYRRGSDTERGRRARSLLGE